MRSMTLVKSAEAPGGTFVFHAGSRDGVMAKFLTRDWWQAGLRGDASGQGASVYAMLAWHGSVVVAVSRDAPVGVPVTGVQTCATGA